MHIENLLDTLAKCVGHKSVCTVAISVISGTLAKSVVHKKTA